MINSNIPGLSSMSMVRAKADIQTESALVTCTCGDVLSDFVVTREGDNSKFFGFGICHKLDINLIDIERSLNVTKGNTIEIGLGDGGDLWDAPYPTFFITELKRDEKTNTITGTAYDKLYWAGEYLFKDLELSAPYTLRQVAQAIATKLGLELYVDTNIYADFLLSYAEGANLDGTETLRAVLNWIAEVTQSIYYVNNLNKLVFKRLSRDGEAVEHITRDDYYELNTKTPRTLSTICNTTELGDNVEASLDGDGAIQYIRNNPFYELRTDLGSLIDKALTNIGGITITQFDCSWVGNYLLEIGDKIALTTEDGGEVYSYLLSDTVTFEGTLNETSEWEYTDEQPETYANPTNIGERINQTFAKVDKVNKEITLQASEIAENKESIGQLQVSTNQVIASVSTMEKTVEDVETKLEDNADAVNARIDSVAKDVSLKLDKQGVEIAIETTLAEGVEKVVTASKKYSFDDSGLNISSSDSEISTTVTEDGMRIYRHSQEVLTVDNTGVQAADLHARTFLIIGENSRLEDRGNRTACFWIGKAGG